MSRRVKVLLSVLAAVVLLTVGGVATVMAQEEPAPTPEASAKSLLATGIAPQIEFRKSSGFVGDNMTAGLLVRVAEILGIPQEDLVGAFKQAQQEIRAEALDKVLDKAIEKGLIDETEASEIREWLEQKPEALDRGLLRRARIFQALRGRQMIAIPRGEGWPRLLQPAD